MVEPQRRPNIVVIGDALLDVDLVGHVERICPDAPVPVLDDPEERPRPGGAGLAAALIAGEGDATTLITALGDDEAADRLRSLLKEAGVVLVDLGTSGSTPEKIRVRAGAQSIVRIDRGGAPGKIGPLTAEARSAIAHADSILVSDYGRGITGQADVREAVRSASPATPVVWDPHPRGASPVAGVTIATPNRSEAARAADCTESAQPHDVAACAQRLAEIWAAEAVCVTMGAAGALLGTRNGGAPAVVPALAFDAPDACGAGDRFAGAAATALAGGATPVQAVTEAVAAASAFVGSGGAAAWTLPRPANTAAPESNVAFEVIERVRAQGGTVVATGGCFDLLHSGHVRVLSDARALGDCLIVCMNSDASVRRLKGETRPIVPEADRAAVLEALAVVDAVVIFDEDTPETVLQSLRPDVWAKGGDYEGRELPEASTMAAWGGSCVVLPYSEGRSTTALMKEVMKRGIS